MLPALPPPAVPLLRVGATLIDCILFMVLVRISPLFLGLAWWCCRLFFHIRSGTSLGKQVFGLRLVDVSDFQHPRVLKCLLHDLLGIIVYASVLDMATLGASAMLVADTTAILFGAVFFGSLLTLMLDRKLGRTLYDYWSFTAVVRKSDSDRFYPAVTAY